MSEPSTADDPSVDNTALTAIGFDVTSPGLETITDAETRLRILRAFRDEHRTTMGEVRESVVDGDGTRARAILHKLMGSTATLGLPTLRTAVIDLHTSIHEAPDAALPARIDVFTTELDRVVTALDNLG